jgi:hypothetical protein
MKKHRITRRKQLTMPRAVHAVLPMSSAGKGPGEGWGLVSEMPAGTSICALGAAIVTKVLNPALSSSTRLL